MKNCLKDLKKGFVGTNRIGKIFSNFGCFVWVLMLSLALSFQSFADTYDHLLSGDVGEFITLADDEISMRNARSSIASIDNTVKWIPNLTTFRIRIVNEETGINSYVWKYLTEASDTQARIKYSAPDGYYISQVNMYNVYNGNYSHSPDPGTYNMELDVTSQFSNELRNVALFSQRRYDNANTVEDFEYYAPQQNSGDFYLSDVNLTISSGLYRWGFYWYLVGGDGSDYVYDIDYTIRQRFEIAEPTEDNVKLTPSGISSSDSTTGYQDSVSSSLSDVNTNLGNISSSMAEQATNIGKVETAVNNLQRAMEPHYDNILQQMHHITEQMAAMWTQVYNLVHVPQYARLGEILTAIQNLDVNITVDVDGLKSTINTMSTNIQNKLGTVQSAIQGTINSGITNVQNKLQNVKEGIEQKLDDKFNHLENGFDNSGITEDVERLDQSLDNYKQVESLLLGEMVDGLRYTEPHEYFDFSYWDAFIEPVMFFSGFVDLIYSNLGGFAFVIQLSLFFTVVSLLLGFHRFNRG